MFYPYPIISHIKPTAPIFCVFSVPIFSVQVTEGCFLNFISSLMNVYLLWDTTCFQLKYWFLQTSFFPVAKTVFQCFVWFPDFYYILSTVVIKFVHYFLIDPVLLKSLIVHSWKKKKVDFEDRHYCGVVSAAAFTLTSGVILHFFAVHSILNLSQYFCCSGGIYYT